jgi:L,D-peptidoglycan transpeptidase YkuD (ErfK/YbiS/YcfS/YnhG family)
VDVNLIEYERRAASGISGGRGTGAGNYQGGTPSAELQNFANNLQGTNDIDTILVRANNVRGTSSVSFTDDNGNTITVPAEIGANGVATDGGTEGDQRTPTGSYQILDNSRIATGTNDAVYTLNGQSNMGSAFVNTNISTSDGRNRGIGFHGSGNNTLRPTNGCIRVSNETLEQLAPHMTPGTVVIIQ